MLKKYFGECGKLSDLIEGYQLRNEQLEMSEEIMQAISDKSVLVVEAGTGTGKTFAYLVPSILSEKKVIISTGSITLQEQLFYKDINALKQIVDKELIISLLKGRKNYLCLHRVEQNLHCQSDFFNEKNASSSNFEIISKLKKWSRETVTGELSNFSDIAEDSKLIPLITSNNDNCLGRKCDFYDKCFVVKARDKAAKSDIIVINHHLFFSDLSLKDSGFGEILPDPDVMIFDEAHQLPDIALQYFGDSFSSGNLSFLIQDIKDIYLNELRDIKQLKIVSLKISNAKDKLLESFSGYSFKKEWNALVHEKSVQNSFNQLIDSIIFAYEVVKISLDRSDELDLIFERLTKLKLFLIKFKSASDSDISYWIEVKSKNYFKFNMTPLDISRQYQEMIGNKDTAWIYTSATISVNETFDYFNKKLGLSPYKEKTFNSPFDFEHQALLCVPRCLPEVNDSNKAERLVELLRNVIKVNNGRCFFLCTSHFVVNKLYDEFNKVLSFPILKQGDKSRKALLEDFKRLGDAILIGTSSFWEGVDIKGDLLSCVIIEKLPFSAPDDPLLKAKIKYLKKQNIDSFSALQLPEAVISLKQGVGRLIRDKEDKGTLIICDNRIVCKSYGSIFLKSLPPLKKTRSIDKVENFILNHVKGDIKK